MPVFPSVWPLLIIIYTLHQRDPWDTHFGANTLPLSSSLSLCENVSVPNVYQLERSSFNQVVSHLTLLCLLFEFPSFCFKFLENIISCAHTNACERANLHVTLLTLSPHSPLHSFSLPLSLSVSLSPCICLSLSVSLSLSITVFSLSLSLHSWSDIWSDVSHLSSHLHVFKDTLITSSTSAYLDVYSETEGRQPSRAPAPFVLTHLKEFSQGEESIELTRGGLLFKANNNNKKKKRYSFLLMAFWQA